MPPHLGNLRGAVGLEPRSFADNLMVLWLYH